MNSVFISARANRPISEIVTPDGWAIINAKERVAPPGAAAGRYENCSLLAILECRRITLAPDRPAGRRPHVIERVGAP